VSSLTEQGELSPVVGRQPVITPPTSVIEPASGIRRVIRVEDLIGSVVSVPIGAQERVPEDPFAGAIHDEAVRKVEVGNRMIMPARHGVIGM
jgi:hypothetical protein